MSWYSYDNDGTYDPFMTYLRSSKTSTNIKGELLSGRWMQHYWNCGCGYVIDPSGVVQDQFCWCPQHPKQVTAIQTRRHGYPEIEKKPAPKPSPPSYWPAREQFVKSTDWETARKYYDMMIEAIEANPPDMDSEQYKNRWAEPAVPKKEFPVMPFVRAGEIVLSLIGMLIACLIMAGVI